VNGWSWRLTPPAERDIKRLDKPVVGRVFEALDKFVAKYPQGDVVKLQGISPPEYRLRVGDWRVRFRPEMQERVVYVLRVLPRGKAYR
jgi:mRNA-degrading endonuclease RelE of RelBE toxin-antitoxin system